MTRGIHVWLRLLGLLALVALAHGPLFAGGHRAPDAALLERAAAAKAPRFKALAAVDPRGAPLAALAQHALARAADGARGAAERPALGARAAALALLLAAAFGLGAFARRLLLPWTGPEHAAAAAWAAVVLAACHPVTTALVADPAALDELLALALGVWCAAAFLRGRQDRELGLVAGAWGLALFGGFAGGLALALPFALAFAELISAHRYRPRRERARTAANTLLIFGAAVAVGTAMWLDKGGATRFADGFARLGAAPLAGARELAGRAAGLALPVNPALVGAAGVLAAGAAILFAFHPAIIAARSAPRTWSRMLGWWLLLLAGAATYGLDASVAPGAPTHASLLALAACALVLGPAVASTALIGVRRAVLPWIVAATWAALAAAGAWAWRDAAEVAGDLGRDLRAARELYGQDARMLVLDARTDVAGVETLGDDVGALVPGQSGVTVLSSDAFFALAFEPEFQALRAERLVVLAPLDALPADAGSLRPGGARQAVRLGPAAASGGPRTWRGIGTWEPGIDTLAAETLVVRAELGSDVGEARRVHWRASDAAVALGSAPCAWIETGDEPVLIADLGASLAWLLGGRARRIWFEGGVVQVTEARLREAPEAFPEVHPTADGDDWLFARVTTPLVESSLQRGRYVLSLLSLRSYAHRTIAVERFGDDLLRAEGAAAAVAALPRPVAWRLDYEVEGVPLARASGRRVGRDGTVEQ